MRIAFFIPTYPAVSLTFIAREMRELERLNCILTIFAPYKVETTLVHPEFVELKARVEYFSRLRDWQTVKILAQNIFMAGVNPKGYLRVLKWIKNITYERRVARWKLILQIGHFAYLVRTLNIERIHAHFALEWAVVAMLTSWIAKVPFSITTHAGDIFANHIPDILPHLLSETDLLVTISEYNRKFMLDSFPHILHAKSVFIVHCGIDLQDFDLISPRSVTQPLSIVTVANLVEKKGHSVLIEALAILKQQGFEFTWTVVGQGGLLPALKALVKEKDLESNVNFVGPAIRDEVQAILLNTDVVVLPCIQVSSGEMDGIPVALMEGMAVGLLVVSTTISGIPELITHGKTGFLVPPNDSMALAKTLRSILENPADFQQMGINAREKIRADFNIKAEGLRLLEIFRSAH